jgi:hypothetical protein
MDEIDVKPGSPHLFGRQNNPILKIGTEFL